MRTTAITATDQTGQAQTARAPALAVVTYNSAEAIRRFGRGHARLAEHLGTMLVYVDNASSDDTLAAIGELESDAVRTIASPENRGYAAGVNRAAAVAEGRDLLLLNPDVEAPDDVGLQGLMTVLNDEPSAALVGPALIYDDGSRQPSARRFPSSLAFLGSLDRAKSVGMIGRAYERYIEPSWGGQRRRVDWVIGAAMLIRRQAFDALGGWDERYFLYMEDVDFCRRAARAGWEAWFEPSVELTHGYARASTTGSASVLRSQARRRHVAGIARLFASEPRMIFGRGRR